MAATANDNKRQRTEGDCYGGSMERLPEHIITQVLLKLELDSLCTAACVSRTFRSAATNLVSSLSSLDLSAISLDIESLKGVARRGQSANSLTIDCLQLKNDSSIINILGEHIQDLSLLKCSFLSYDILSAIGERCPNLRFFLIEIAGRESPELFKWKLIEMLQKTSLLEFEELLLKEVISEEPVELFLMEGLQGAEAGARVVEAAGGLQAGLQGAEVELFEHLQEVDLQLHCLRRWPATGGVGYI